MEDRKARLAALAAKAGRVAPGSEEPPAVTEPTSDNSKRNIHFRNYIPSDPKLANVQQSFVEDKTTSNKRPRMSGPGMEPVLAKEKSMLEVALEKARSEISSNSMGVRKDALNLPPEEEKGNTRITSTGQKDTPPKINADLKRRIQPQLDRLQKRTQKAIVILLRERLEREAASSSSPSQNAENLD